MKFSFLIGLVIFSLASISLVASDCQEATAQDSHAAANNPQSQETMQDMSGMHHQPEKFVDEILHHATAGTSAQPNSTAEPMIMLPKGNWLFMFHGAAF